MTDVNLLDDILTMEDADLDGESEADKKSASGETKQTGRASARTKSKNTRTSSRSTSKKTNNSDTPPKKTPTKDSSKGSFVWVPKEKGSAEKKPQKKITRSKSLDRADDLKETAPLEEVLQDELEFSNMSSSQKESILSILEEASRPDGGDNIGNAPRTEEEEEEEKMDLNDSGGMEKSMNVSNNEEKNGEEDQDEDSRSATSDEGSHRSRSHRSRSSGRSNDSRGSSRSGSESGDDGDDSFRRKRKISPIQWDREKRSESRESGAGSAKRSRKEGAEPETKEEVDRADQVSKLRYILRQARYYLIKSNNYENVALAKAKGVWSTPPMNEAKLNGAFKDCRNVILVFSVRESGMFQGFARIIGESDKNHPPIRWLLPEGLSASVLKGVFKLDWINRNELEFMKTAGLFNTWNENKLVKVGRDGQEIEPRCGESLCRLFPPDDAIDLKAIALKAKRDRRRVAEEQKEKLGDKFTGKYTPNTPLHGTISNRSPRGRDGPPPRRPLPPRRDARETARFPGRGRDYERNGSSSWSQSRPSQPDRRDRRERSERYGGVRRETILNGTYNDYMREHMLTSTRPPPMSAMPMYTQPVPGAYGPVEPPPNYPSFSTSRPPRNDYGPPALDYSQMTRSTARIIDKRYERDVDDFLRRTAHGSSTSDRSRRERPRERSRSRDRQRDRDYDRHRAERDRRQDRR